MRVREDALPEIMEWCDKHILEEGDDIHNEESPLSIMVSLFKRIKMVLEFDEIDTRSHDMELDDEIDIPVYQQFVHENLLHKKNEAEEHLPIPVFSYIKPTMGVSFILHILLSMGRFETEIDLTLHPNIKESFRYAKLIGEADDRESLKKDADALTRQFILSQVRFFPNSKRVIDHWIIVAANLFQKVIVDDHF